MGLRVEEFRALFLYCPADRDPASPLSPTKVRREHQRWQSLQRAARKATYVVQVHPEKAEDDIEVRVSCEVERARSPSVFWRACRDTTQEYAAQRRPVAWTDPNGMQIVLESGQPQYAAALISEAAKYVRMWLPHVPRSPENGFRTKIYLLGDDTLDLSCITGYIPRRTAASGVLWAMHTSAQKIADSWLAEQVPGATRVTRPENELKVKKTLPSKAIATSAV